MDQTLLILLRAIHIFSGVFWAGSVLSGALVSLPVLRGMGPEGRGFFRQFTESRRAIAFFAGSSLLTVLSGVVLFWLVYGFAGAWSPTQWAFAIGGLFALFSPGLGAVIGKLISPAPVADADTTSIAAENRLRGMAVMLSVTVILMATARYMA